MYYGLQPSFSSHDAEYLQSNGTSATYTLKRVYHNTSNVDVLVSGIEQYPNTYNLSGNQIMFSEPPPAAFPGEDPLNICIKPKAGVSISQTFTLPTDLAHQSDLSEYANKSTYNIFQKNQVILPVTLVDAATLIPDADSSSFFKIDLSSNRILGNPANLRDGHLLQFRIKQDPTGNRTLTYGTKYKFAGGTVPVLSTSANAVDFLSCIYDGTLDILICNLIKDIK